MGRVIGDRSHYGDLVGVTMNGFIQADTRLTVALPTGNVGFAVHIGMGSACTLQADRAQVTSLRDLLTAALDAEQEQPS